MPIINPITVTNNNTNAVWTPLQGQTYANNRIRISANDNGQPPAGFLAAGHQYAITGNEMPTGATFNRNNLQWDQADSEPPRIYSFQ